MGTDTAILERAPTYVGSKHSPSSTGSVSLRFGGRGHGDSPVQQQIDEIIRSSLEQAGFPQPNELAGEGHCTPPKTVGVIAVAQGIAVRSDEYEERYGSIDLDDFRRHMSPELFSAFVRHIGAIPGHRDLDVTQTTTIPYE